ncbi:hypothetical protein ABH930_003673 [Kitasatospora sp. GAS204A]|uniref:hypothetical protein n=1 Tax=unclassified Kitasatospora TaxID=2633591 RepID=UPI0024748E57|nr:hypothetical protein [Kitasatospora sp. GAS204B]MDH6118728.1 hypothetical protein [Kitasatospora sp. GAS204B]
MSTPPQAQPGYGYGYPVLPAQPPQQLPPQQPPVEQPVQGPTPVPRGRRLLRRARWGFAGALVASAFWTVAVWTVPGMVRPPSAALSTGAYRVTDNLCATAPLTRLGQLYPVSAGTPNHFTTRTKALDDMSCTEYLKRSATDAGYVSVYLDTSLHHAVNPAAEFASERSALSQRQFQTGDVPELGSQAFTGYQDLQSGPDRNQHFVTQLIYVRDGGAVFYLSWTGSYEAGKDSVPDRDGIRQAVVIDARDALRALGGRG